MRGGLAALGLFVVLRLLAARWPGLAEAWAERVAPPAAGLAGALPGLLPFSLAEVLLYLAIVGAPLAVVAGYRRGRASGLSGLRAAGRVALRAAAAVGILLLSFDLLWGLHYARPPLAERLRLAPGPDDGHLARRELVELAGALVVATNDAYRELNGAEDRGHPTDAPALAELTPALATGYERAGAAGLATAGKGAVRLKPFAGSVLLSHLGLSGFFFPWTAEPNVNARVPGSHLPHVAAHEIAHRRGFAREDEAQFAGFLACVFSGSKAARYSGLLYAQRELLGQLHRDPATVQALVARRVPGVQRDVDAMRAFWDRYQGPPARAADAVNHAYLTAQGVPGGISSYRQGVRLLLLCAREGRPGCAAPFGLAPSR